MGKLVQGLQGQSLRHRGKQSVKGSGETIEQLVLREQREPRRELKTLPRAFWKCSP